MNFNGKVNRAQYIANKKASATQTQSQFFNEKVVLPSKENRAINNYRSVNDRIIKRR